MAREARHFVDEAFFWKCVFVEAALVKKTRNTSKELDEHQPLEFAVGTGMVIAGWDEGGRVLLTTAGAATNTDCFFRQTS